MPNLIVSPSEDDIMTGLRAFMLALFPDLGGANIVQGQQNRLTMPIGPDFIIFSPADRGRLSTSVRTYDAAGGTRETEHSTQIGVQIDFYGPSSTDIAQVFATLFRDLYGCDFLKPYGIQPLWSDDGRQMPLVDGERQYVARWMVRTVLQANPSVSTSQDFADTIAVKIVEAD